MLVQVTIALALFALVVAPSGQRPGLDPHPSLREPVIGRPAGRVGRDDGRGDAELLDLLRQAVAVPVRVVLALRAEEDLVAAAAGDDPADGAGGVLAAVDELDGPAAALLVIGGGAVLLLGAGALALRRRRTR